MQSNHMTATSYPAEVEYTSRATWQRPRLMIDDTASSTHAFSAFTEDGGLQVS
jgi:hypothetical protein